MSAVGAIGRVGRLGLSPGRPTGFDPRSIIAGRPWAIWYDPNALGSMYQDLAMTIPAAEDQPVAVQLDLSGFGNHRHQPTAINRPYLRKSASGYYYLEPNGSSSWMQTINSVDCSSSDKMTAFAGVVKTTTALGQMIFELSSSQISNPGTAQLRANLSSNAEYIFGSRGTASSAAIAITPNTYPANEKQVITTVGDISGNLSRILVGNPIAATSTNNQGAGNYGNYPFFFFSRGGTSLFSSAHSYAELIVGGLVEDSQARQMRSWVAQRMGVTL